LKATRPGVRGSISLAPVPEAFPPSARASNQGAPAGASPFVFANDSIGMRMQINSTSGRVDSALVMELVESGSAHKMGLQVGAQLVQVDETPAVDLGEAVLRQMCTQRPVTLWFLPPPRDMKVAFADAADRTPGLQQGRGAQSELPEGLPPKTANAPRGACALGRIAIESQARRGSAGGVKAANASANLTALDLHPAPLQPDPGPNCRSSSAGVPVSPTHSLRPAAHEEGGGLTPPPSPPSPSTSAAPSSAAAVSAASIASKTSLRPTDGRSNSASARNATRNDTLFAAPDFLLSWFRPSSRASKSPSMAATSSANATGVGAGGRGSTLKDVPRFVPGRTGVTAGGSLLPVAKQLTFRYDFEEPPPQNTAEADRFHLLMLLSIWEETIEVRKQCSFWGCDEQQKVDAKGPGNAGKARLQGAVTAVTLATNCQATQGQAPANAPAPHSPQQQLVAHSLAANEVDAAQEKV